MSELNPVSGPVSDNRPLSLRVAFTLVSWFALVLALSFNGNFRNDPVDPPWFIIGALVIPLLLFALAWFFSGGFRHWVLHQDLRLLVLLHTFRTVGIGFILLAAHGVLPWVFAIPAGSGDALAAVWALMVFYSLSISRNGISRRSLLAWNTFGIVDFVLAVVAGVLSREGRILHFADSVSSVAMGDIPLVLIPAFIVPLYLLSHLMILAQVWRLPVAERIRV